MKNISCSTASLSVSHYTLYSVQFVVLYDDSRSFLDAYVNPMTLTVIMVLRGCLFDTLIAQNTTIQFLVSVRLDK